MEHRRTSYTRSSTFWEACMALGGISRLYKMTTLDTYQQDWISRIGELIHHIYTHICRDGWVAIYTILVNLGYVLNRLRE